MLNGLIFKKADVDSLVDCLKKIPNCDLKSMGEESKIVFKNNFDSLITNKKLNKIYKQYV